MIIFYRALNILINLIEFLILVRIIFSFINIGSDNVIGKLVFDMTEPILSPARNLIKRLNIDTGFFDFSPLLAILLLRIISSIVRRLLFF